MLIEIDAVWYDREVYFCASAQEMAKAADWPDGPDKELFFDTWDFFFQDLDQGGYDRFNHWLCIWYPIKPLSRRRPPRPQSAII